MMDGGNIGWGGASGTIVRRKWKLFIDSSIYNDFDGDEIIHRWVRETLDGVGRAGNGNGGARTWKAPTVLTIYTAA